MRKGVVKVSKVVSFRSRRGRCGVSLRCLNYHCYKPCSPALQSLMPFPHSELRTWWALIRRLAFGSRML